MSAMTPAERDEVFSVCILRSWPQWVIYRARGKDVPPSWQCKQALLQSGFSKAIVAMKSRKKAA